MQPFQPGGISGISSNNVDAVFQRDIGLALPQIEKRVIQIAEQIFIDSEDSEGLAILSVINNYWISSFKSVIEGSFKDVLCLQEMHDYIHNTPRAYAIEALLNRLHFLFLRAYLCVTKEMTQGLFLGEDSKGDYSEVVLTLMLLPVEKQRTYIKDLRESGALPSNVNLSQFLKPVKKLLTDFKKEQDKLVKEFTS